MSNATSAAVNWVEQGFVPDPVIRLGIRRLLKTRLEELHSGDPEVTDALATAFVQHMRGSDLALLPEKANQQHYEVPAEFFQQVLGPNLKYSACHWPAGVDTLAQAEVAALEATCQRAGIADGQNILELGCGWGSLSLWMAGRYPRSQITALSNSRSQREHIEAMAASRGFRNVQVVTCDFNAFDTTDRFDRIVSVEMFEHLRNWERAFEHVARWLKPDGQFFMHVFAHREAPYPFEERDDSDWMSRHFFSGGMMPSDDLALRFQDHLSLVERWRWCGKHYQRTSEAWLSNMDARRAALKPVFDEVYGTDAGLWWMRWRLFFMAVAELFGWDDGQQWWVSHYLFKRRGAELAGT